MAGYTVEFWLILQMIIEVLLCGIIGYYVSLQQLTHSKIVNECALL